MSNIKPIPPPPRRATPLGNLQSIHWKGALISSPSVAILPHVMSHPPEILEGKFYKPGWPTPLSQVLCQLQENNSKEHDYRSLQGTLEAIWKPWDLWHMTLKFGAYILQLSDGRRGLVFTAKWRGGYASPRRAQFVGPGPTPLLEEMIQWAESA